MIKQSKGVTLVVLVVTIIILLILAGVSLKAFTGSGLFQKATDAKEQAKLAELEEQMRLAITEMIANKNGEKITIGEYIDHLTEKMEITDRYEEDGKQVIEVDDKYVFEILNGDPYIIVDKVGIKEKLPPRLTLSSITHTTNSITVEVTTKRNEGGKIEYYIKSEDEEEYILKETTTDTSYTYKELEQNKKYNIKIVAIAKNEQTDEILVDRTTGNVPDLTTGDIIFTYSVDGQEIDKETWTNKNVIVTATTTITGYTLQTSTDGITWEGTASQTFSENGQIYVVLYDGTNYGGSATGNVTNIDKLSPKDFTPTAESTTKSITVIASTEDADATDTSGKSGIAGYRFKLDSGEWTGYQTSGTYTWDNLAQTTSHTITVEAKDNAGNTTTATVNKGTGTVTSGTETGAITFSTATWSGGKASTTISTNTSYTIQYQVNSTTGTWTIGTSVTGLSHGDKVYARLWDGTNGGDYTTLNIIDAVVPTTATLNAGTVSSARSVVLTASGTDNESGIKEYAIYVNGSKVSSTNTYTITNMPFNTSYSCYAIVTDAAGNTKQSSTITTINQLYVGDATDLKNLATAVNSGNTFSGKIIIQTANIDLGGNSSNQWTPIGNSSYAFSGTYDGKNKTISNIYINNTSNYQGLFGYSTGSISNLTISNGTIKGNRYIGGIVGYIKGTIKNCHNYSSLGGQYYIGGIVGCSEGTITQCSNYGLITSIHIQTNLTSGALGGIAGAQISTSGSITYCFNKGNVTLNSSITGINVGCAGGIVGLMYGNTKCCYNTGAIYARDFFASGIVGACRKEGWINYCYNIGSIKGNGNKNGIIGWDNHVDITPEMIYKIYYLDTCGGTGSGESINSETMKTKYGTNVLYGFKKDTNNINGGYPILEWQ